MTKKFEFTRRSVLCAPLALAACRIGPSILEFTGVTMGTTYSVVAIDRAGSTSETEAKQAVTQVLAAVNAEMSNWDSGSEISRFNEARTSAAMPVSPALAKVVEAAKSVSLASDGQFDLTLGPLIELWGFGAPQSLGVLPSENAIADALAFSGRNGELSVSGGTLAKARPGTEIYVSSLGKGHGVDRVAETLESLGLRDYLVEIGGDMKAAGRNADGLPWQVGIETPSAINRGIQKVVGVTDLGVATSGDYRNYFERDGVRYSHILDGLTGRPVTHTTASATVIAENAMMADAWSTAMLVLGRDRGLEVAEEHALSVLFIERDADAAGQGFVPSASPAFNTLVS